MSKEIVELMKRMIEDGNLSEEVAMKYCPELKESEDEKIRKDLIIYLRSILSNKKYGDKFIEGWIAWLEKQGEQKPLVIPKFRKGDFIRYKTNPDDVERVDCVMDDHYILDIKDKCTHVLFTCQDLWELVEQNPIDKVKPKFNVGDWVMLDRPVLITKVEDMPYNTHQYWNSDGTWFGDATNAKLWNISDAKDGDVLVNWNNTIYLFKGIEKEVVKFYCYYNTSYKEFHTPLNNNSHLGLTKPQFEHHPATLEQRDLLFQKMEEAGYEWDAEKKELKKIEQKPVEWSEEDELFLQVCKNALDKYQVSDKWDAGIISRWLEEKLKSLRPQNTWKPSEEQMYILNWVTNLLNDGMVEKHAKGILESLYNDLKKLKG